MMAAAILKSLMVVLTIQAIFLSIFILWICSSSFSSLSTKSLSGRFQIKKRDTNRGATAVHDGSLSPSQSEVSNLVQRREARCDRPVTNFVFIKVHKTASGSTFTLLARFGRNHGMTICYPANPSKAHNKRLSYPSGKLARDDCNPAFERNYTLLIHHSIMNKSAMDRIMEPGTKYIGIIREPLNHFRSIFFWEQHILRHHENPLATFLNMNENFKLGKKSVYSKHRNFQAYTLGFPTKLMASKNISQLYEALRTVASWYSIILITEYWEESLVLLRRTFCWTMYDILHSTKRLHHRIKSKKDVTLTNKQKDTHRKMSNIDYMMYDYFNNTFWQRVAEEGPEFWEEVAYYKTLNREVNQHCDSTNGIKVFPAGKWSQEFMIDSTFCIEMQKWAEGKWALACRDVVERQNEAFLKKNDPNLLNDSAT